MRAKFWLVILAVLIITIFSLCGCDGYTNSNGNINLPVSTEKSAQAQPPMPTPAPTPSPTPEPTPAPTVRLDAGSWLNNQQWVTNDADVSGAGVSNVILGASFFTEYTTDEIKSADCTSVSLGQIEKAEWKYIGKLVSVTLTSNDVTCYAPGSDASNTLAGGKECAEVSVSYKGAGYSHIIVIGSGMDTLKKGTHKARLLVVGYFTGTNAFGGEVQNMFMMTTSDLIK